MRRRARPVLLVVVVVVAAVGLGPATAASDADPLPPHPRLLFDAGDVADLRARVEEGVPAALWVNLRDKAERYMDPTALRHADPDAPNSSGQNIQGVYLTDLAFAYILSGDERYGRHVVDMLLGLVAEGWPAWNENELGRGDLTKGVALAFDWTYDLMTPEERATITNSLVDGLPGLDPETGEPRAGPGFSGVFSCLNRDHPWLDTHENNWNGVCGGGNGLALLAIAGEDGVPDLTPWLSVAKSHLLRYFQSGFGVHGDGQEGHAYAAYGLHNALPFVVALERLTGENLVDQAANIVNLVEWLAFEQLPGWGSRWTPRNDAGTPGPLMAEVIPFFFLLRPGDGLVGWLWDHTVGPDGDDITEFGDWDVDNPLWPGDPSCAVPLDNPEEAAIWVLFCARSPEVFSILYYESPDELPRTSPGDVLPNARHYPEFGLATFRTGWDGTGEFALTFEAKRQASGHSQLDAGNFTIYGFDAMFAVDSGYGHNYSCVGNPTAQVAFGCTDTDPMIDSGRAVGHNVVLVDFDRDSQGPFGRMTTDETITEFAAGPTVGLARADLHRAYSGTGLGTAPWAERDFLFRHVEGDPVLVVVADRMRRGDEEHTYQWTMHTDAKNLVTFDSGLPDPLAGLPAPAGGGGFTVTAPNGATLTGAVAEAHGTPLLFARPWDAARYMANPPLVHQVVTSSTLPQRDLDHLAVLAVSPAGGPATSVAPLDASGGTLVAATWPGSQVLVASSTRDSGGVTASRLTTDGELAVVTVDGAETVLAAGTVLAADDRDYITVTGGPASVVVGGDAISVHGPAGNTYRVHAPQAIASVVVNGDPVSACRDGADLLFPC